MSAVGAGEGRQRLDRPHDGSATGRADRRPGPRPPAATDAVGLRLRAARTGRAAPGTPSRSVPSPRRSRTRPRGIRRAGSATSGSTPRSRTNGPLDPDGALRAPCAPPAGVRPPPIQPNATRIIDLRPDEDALLADLRKKWRQYVNKARTGGVTVVDADARRLGEFYRIYRETADRAGFLIRAESAYRDVWDAFAPVGERAAALRPGPRRASRRRRCSSSAAGRASSSRTAG